MEAVRSMTGVLSPLLIEAERAHKEAVQAGKAVDADWPCWYAGFVAKRLVPTFVKMLTGDVCLVADREERRSHARSAVELAQTWETDPDTRMRYPVAHVHGRMV